jgi:carbamate kinase
VTHGYRLSYWSFSTDETKQIKLRQCKNKNTKPNHAYIYRILQIGAIKTILEQAPDILPIACGGGGIPVSRVPSNPTTLAGVEAVIDKDACGAKLAVELEADGFIILTDGGGIWQNFGKPNAREMKKASPGE